RLDQSSSPFRSVRQEPSSRALLWLGRVGSNSAKRGVRIRVVEDVEGGRFGRLQLERIVWAGTHDRDSQRGVLFGPQQRDVRAAALPMEELDHAARAGRVSVPRFTL